MSASVSSWLPFADKLRKDRLCPGPRTPPALRGSGARLSAGPVRELPSLVSSGSFKRDIFQTDTFIPPLWPAPPGSLPWLCGASLHIDSFLMKSLSD